MSQRPDTKVDRDIGTLRETVLRMARLSEAILGKSLQAIWERNPALSLEVKADDIAIDRLDVEIDDTVLRILALDAPVASDLRLVVAVKSIATDLERVGDIARNIAGCARRLSEVPEIGLPPELAGSAPGTLAEKLMAALQGANVAGADTRCLDEGVSSRSAFLRVAYPGDDPDALTLDLVVSLTPFGVEPIDVLQEEFNAWNGTSGLTEQNGDAPLLITRQAGGQVALKWGGPTPTDLIAFDELGARVGSVTLSGPWTTWQLPTDGTLFLRLVDPTGNLLSTMQYSGRSPAPNTQGSDRE